YTADLSARRAWLLLPNGREFCRDSTRNAPTTRVGTRGAGSSCLVSTWKGKEHPMNIRDVMTSNPRTVSPSDMILSAARIMRDDDTGAVPVVENGRPVGMVTDRDIVVRAVASGELDRPVRDVVSGDVITASPDMSTKEAAQLMSDYQVRRLPVVENDRLVGIVSIGDLAVKEGDDKRMGDALQGISQGVKERER